MRREKLIWPPKVLKDVPDPRQVLEEQVQALHDASTDLEPQVGSPRKGEKGESRVDLTIRLLGRKVEIATVEYPEDGYPALVITGDAPHWRYTTAYSPDELVDILQHELSRDGRLANVAP